MMEEMLFPVLYRTLRERRENLASYLANGGAPSYDVYRESVGRIAEIDALEEEIKALEKRLMDQ